MSNEGEKKGKIRFGFKNFVRAISPLIRSTSTNKQAETSSQEDDEIDSAQYDWDLTNVDLKFALKNFYRQYNPEKSFIVGEILQKYEGDEIVLLQQLCDRYHLTQQDMQDYLDQAPSKDHVFQDKLKENTTRRPSASIFNKSNNNMNKDSDVASRTSKESDLRKSSSPASKNKSRDKWDTDSAYSGDGSKRQPPTRKPSLYKKESFVTPETLQTVEEKDDNYSNSAESPTTAGGGGDIKTNFQHYYWDLTDVDVAKALKVLYKELNPKKSPNLSILDHKNNKELLHLLRQLCKRHCLTEKEMAVYLNNAKKAPVQKPVKDVEDESLVALDTESIPDKPKPLADSNMMTGRNLNRVPSREEVSNYMKESSSRKAEHYSNSRNQLAAAYQAPSFQEESFQDDNEQDEEESYQRIQPYVSSGSSHPPPPPGPPTGQNKLRQNASSARKNYAPFSGEVEENVDDEMASKEEDHSTSRYSVEHLKPLLPNGTRLSYGPIIRELSGTSQQAASSSRPQQPLPGSNSSTSSGTNQKKTLLQKTPSNDSSNKRFQILADTNSTEGGPQLSDPQLLQTTSTTTTAAAVSAPSNPELDLFRNELAKAKEQIAEMSKENAMVLTWLKQSNFNILNAPLSNQPNESASTVQVPPKEHKGVQAEDFTIKTELSKMKNRVSLLEVQNRRLEKETESLAADKVELSQQITDLQSTKQDLELDKQDLLQLLNILATAPVPAKNVLESYLSKLSSNASEGSNLREKVFEAKSSPIGDRIYYLLQWKRNNEKINQKKKDSSLPSSSSPTKREESERDGRKRVPEIKEENEVTQQQERSQSPVVSISTEDYQRFEGKDLLLALTKDDKLLLDDSNSDSDQQLSSPLVSPQERKAYARMNVAGLNPPEKKLNSTTPPSSRSTTPNSTKRLKVNHSEQATQSNSLTSTSNNHENLSTTSSTITNNASIEKQQQQLLNEQYELARKYYQYQQSQSKVSEKLNKSNLVFQELETNRAMKDAIETAYTNPATAQLRSSTSPQRLPSANNTVAAANTTPSTAIGATANKKEWIECFDPKSQRKYYYNTILKKSTWKNPFVEGGSATNVNTSNAANGSAKSHIPSSGNNSSRNSPIVRTRDATPQSYYSEDSGNSQYEDVHIDQDEPRDQQRSNSPTGAVGGGGTSERQYDRQGYPINNGREVNRSAPTSRTTSPFLKNYMNTTQSQSASVAVTQNSESSKRSNSSSRSRESTKKPEDVWVTAIDPKSQRRYWYNRETKVSTWRKPIELN